MVSEGTIIGIRTYSYTPENSNKKYEGYSICIARDPAPDSSQFGKFADTVSISFRDIGSYAPELDDRVRYATYRDDRGKVKCGFIIPL